MKARRFLAIGVLACLVGLVLAGAAEDRRPDTAKVAKYVRFQVGQTIAYGMIEGDRVRQLAGDLFQGWSKTEKTSALDEVKLLVPATPSKILALAGNYRSHVATQPATAHPEVFFKPPSALVADGGEIVIPTGTNEVHYEAELVIVIGRRARNVSVEEAPKYVLGVTCGNDVSARDWQQNDRQWWRAKGCDTFAPCGPVIVSGLNYDDLLVELRLNGEVRQSERTSAMVHGVAATVSWISRHVTLEPGDLIYTGTSGKTGAIKPGDVVEVTIEGVGRLKNRVAASE